MGVKSATPDASSSWQDGAVMPGILPGAQHPPGSARAAVTAHHGRASPSHSTGGSEPEVKVPAGPGPGGALSPGCGLHPHMAERQSKPLESLLLRTLILWDQGSVLVASLNLNYLLRSPISKYSPTVGVGPRHTNLRVYKHSVHNSGPLTCTSHHPGRVNLWAPAGTGIPRS